MRFKCLPGCALCCHHKVYLLLDDVEKIRSNVKTDDFWVKDSTEGGRVIGYLKREERFCTFLTKERFCSIYPQRPLYCRLYPFMEEVYFHSEMDVDLSCPGLNYGREISLSQLKKMFDRDLSPRVNSTFKKKVKSTVDKLEDLLKQRGCYTSKNLCFFITKSLIEDSLKEKAEKGVFLFRERVNLSGSLIEKMGNISTIKQAQKLIREMFKKQTFSQKGIPLQGFFKKEFNQPLFNTEISKGKVTVYTMEFNPELIKWSFSDTSQSVEFTKLKEIKIDEGGRNLLLEYMKFWMRRQLLFRLAYSYALIDFRARNYLYFYLQSLVEGLLRVYSLAKVVAVKEKKKEASLSEVREAIRASDSILRRRCQAKIKIEEIKNG